MNVPKQNPLAVTKGKYFACKVVNVSNRAAKAVLLAQVHPNRAAAVVEVVPRSAAVESALAEEEAAVACSVRAPNDAVRGLCHAHNGRGRDNNDLCRDNNGRGLCRGQEGICL